MQAHVPGLLVLDVGTYGENVTRQNGAPIYWVDVYDQDGDDRAERTARMTIAEDVDPQALVACRLSTIEAEITWAKRDGKWKPRVDSFKATASKPSNGKPAQVPAAA